MRKLTLILAVAARYRFSILIKLTHIYIVCPVLTKIMPSYVYLYRAVVLARLKLSTKRDIRRFQAIQRQILDSGTKGYTVGLNELGLNPEAVATIEQKHQNSKEVVIADIDQTGLWFSHHGPINDVPQIKQTEFRERYRFKIQIVSLEGIIGVRKNYNGNAFAFVNELRALSLLAKENCNVPAVMAIDFDKLTLTISYIKGDPLDDLIAKIEAETIYKNTEKDGNLITLVSGRKRSRNIRQGPRPLDGIFDKTRIDDLLTQLKKIHRTGIILKDIKYGNIIIERNTGKPFWIDFDYTRYYANVSKPTFAFLRDIDIERFNLLFKTDCPTYKNIKARASDKKSPFIKGWYAPMYFGFDLKIGKLFDCNVGFGRWNYLLKKHLPSLSGKRVLDLGANNAFNSLHMLRAGASQAIAIELESENIERGMFAKAAFEWSDAKQYDLQYVHTNMKDVPSLNLGNFDVAIALCSLYYLNDEQIADLIRHISTLTDLFLVQCNISPTVARGDDHIRTKSSVSYTLDMLKANGFDSTKLIAPNGYTRPLIIAKKT